MSEQAAGKQDVQPALPLWKRVLFYFVMAAIVITVLEVSAIIYLRAFRGYDGEHLMQYQFDPYKNIIPTPNYVDTRGIRHNSVGFRRSSEVSVNKPSNTYRIFLMGASTAYGTGGLWSHLQRDFAVLDNSETIDAYLEQILDATFDTVNIEVINAAISSTWTHHHLIYLNQTILRYDPDLIIFIDGYNDFFQFERSHDQFRSYLYKDHSQHLMGEPTLYSLAYSNLWWLFRRSAFAHVTARALRSAKQILTPRPELRPLDVETTMAALAEVFPRNALKMIQRTALLLEHEGVHGIFVLQPQLILERGRLGRMPLRERELFEFNVASTQPNFEQFMQRAVAYVSGEERRAVESQGGVFVDATAIYADAEVQIFTDYAHLSPKGNEILAQHLTGFIEPLLRRDIASGSAPGAAAPHEVGVE